MAIPNQFLRRRSTIAFFTQEDDAFVYKYPAPTDALVTVDPIDLNQTLNFTDLSEVGTRLLNTQSVLNYGERTDTSFQVISKIKENPATIAEFAPAEHFLLLQLMGAYNEYTGATQKSIGGTLYDCVGYSFKDTPRTFQINQLVNGHMLKCGMGSILSGGSLNISREGALTWEVNGRTAKIGYSGTAAIDVAATQAANTTNAGDTLGIIELSFADPNAKAADVLKIGDHFAIVDGGTSANQGNVLEDENVSAAAGATDKLEVLSVSGNTVTLASGYSLINGFTAAEDPYIVPILPNYDLSTQPANVIPQGNARIFMAPRDATLDVLFNPSNGFLASDFTLNIDKNLGDPGVGELNGELYPAPTYVAQDYSVSGTMGFVVRPADLFRFNSMLRDYDKALGIKIEVPSVDLNTGLGTYRTVYIALRSCRLSFEGSENEGAEGASISYVVTRGGAAIQSDADLMEIIYA